MICNAQQAIALHPPTKPAKSRLFVACLRCTVLAAALALPVLMMTGCDDLQAAHAAAADQVAGQQHREDRGRRLRAAQQVCGTTATAIWLDDRTIYCARHMEASR